MSDEDDPPEYLKDVVAQPRSDNFGPDDTGPLFDPAKTKLIFGYGTDTRVEDYGYDPDLPLDRLVAALIKGAQPELTERDLRTACRQVVKQITGKKAQKKNSRAAEPDHEILLHIAWEVHVRHHSTRLVDFASISIAPIARYVLKNYFPDRATERNIDSAEHAKRLAEAFRKDAFRLVSMAAAQYDWERMDETRILSQALESLGKVSIPVDASAAKPRTFKPKSQAQGFKS